MDLVAVNPEGTLYVSGEIEDWEALRERGISRPPASSRVATVASAAAMPARS